MDSLWFSFVPYHVARNLIATPTSTLTGNLFGREERFETVALFADVSGFTAISEALGKTGKVGSEELTLILNSYFEPMINLITSYGGIIAKFGGDALTVLFPYRSRTRFNTVRRAIQCALDMQTQIMPHYKEVPTSLGMFSLAMKAGLAIGPVVCTNVGGEGRTEYIVAGEVLDRCAEAEHYAAKGEVVVQRDLLLAGLKAVSNQALAISNLVEIVEERGNKGQFVCLNQPKLVRRIRLAPLPPLPQLTSPEAAQLITPFLPPTLAHLIVQGQSSFINEHRLVTILFVTFSGFDYDHDPTVAAKLQAYFAQVLKTVGRYDGYLNKIDMGDKGSKYIVLFGAPLAHENDPERAVRCALELVAQADDYVSGIKIGINTGFVYSGLVGSSKRQEYTVMGDAVNLAARIMQAAQPQQILVSSFTQSHLADKFEWQALEPINVKGKSELVLVYSTHKAKQPLVADGRTGLLQEPAYALPMVGRGPELALATAKIEQMRTGHGQIIGITAEAGMGKSRLNAEIVKLVLNQGSVRFFGGECLSYGTNSPYLVWHNIWRGLFNHDQTLPLDMQIQHLAEQLAKVDNSLLERLPLLGPVLNMPIPDNAFTASLEAKIRKTALETMLVECLKTQFKADQSQPLLLVLEDCHWIDPLSYDLLKIISRNLADLPVLLISLYRPSVSTGLDYFRTSPLMQLNYFTEINLHEFTIQEAERLIKLKLAQLFGDKYTQHNDSVTWLVERVTSKAQGNPFYIDEMVNLIQDKGIDPTDTKALAGFELPDSLYNLIISRIDQLAESEKITLKVASVIGRLFRAEWLWHIYSPLGAPHEVKARLAHLSRLELTPLDKPEPELEYLFKHVITQEVAYDSLALATRSLLHEQVGQFVEQSYVETLSQYVDLLAYHYGRSQNIAKQREYYRKAGTIAENNYANAAALDYYQRLLPLLTETEQAEIVLRLGAIQELVGKWNEAETLYRQVLTTAQKLEDARNLARSQRALGYLLHLKGGYEEALNWLEAARQGFERIGDQEGVSHAIGNIGLVYARHSEYQQALDCYQQQLDIATGINFQTGASAAIGNIGLVYQQQGDYERALNYYQRKLELDTDIGKRRGVSIATGNIGRVYEQQGNYLSALENYIKKLQLDSEIGDRQNMGRVLGNMGVVYFQLGDYEQSIVCYKQALQVAIEINDQQVIAAFLGNVAKVYSMQNRFDLCKRLYNLATIFGRNLKLPYFLCDSLYGKAELLNYLQQYSEAQLLNDEALNISNMVGRKDIQFKARLLSVDLKVKLQQITLNQAKIELNEWLKSLESKAEQAEIYYKIWFLDQTEAAYRQTAADLYGNLYAQIPNLEYKQRYQELSYKQLPKTPTLPEIPPLITSQPLDIEAVLVQIEAIAANL